MAARSPATTVPLDPRFPRPWNEIIALVRYAHGSKLGYLRHMGLDNDEIYQVIAIGLAARCGWQEGRGKKPSSYIIMATGCILLNHIRMINTRHEHETNVAVDASGSVCDPALVASTMLAASYPAEAVPALGKAMEDRLKAKHTDPLDHQAIEAVFDGMSHMDVRNSGVSATRLKNMRQIVWEQFAD